MTWSDIYRVLIGVAPQTVAHDVRHWIAQLGGVGLIPLGLLDASVVPIPGSMDVLTIVLAARDSKLWFYYAGMATLGSVIGALVTFRLARKGGKETLKRKVSAARAERIIEIFSRWGFWSIAIAALLPPPVPMVPFVIAAGATQYSTEKFLVALTLARMIRYSLLALLAALWQADHKSHRASCASVFVCGFWSGGGSWGDCICSAVGAKKETDTRLELQGRELTDQGERYAAYFGA